jgi:CIC family chloride channel protein
MGMTDPDEGAPEGNGPRRRRPPGVAAERFRSGFERRRGQLAVLGRRGSQVLLLASLTGVLTGLAVTGFEWVTRDQLFEGLHDQPIGVQIAAPLVGLMLAQAILRSMARTTSPATADEYVHNFHEMGRRLDLRPLPGRILASMATLGFGGALGYEGPSIYLGAGIGTALQARFSRLFSRSDTKLLLVAGAAAGVAAIFKAPATGLVFALEVPYQEDFAHRMLLPAGIAAASSYVVFAAFYGTAPLIAVRGAPPFNFRDLAGAVVLGVICGVGARGFTRALVRAKQVSGRTNPWVRAAAAGVGLGGLAAASYALFGSALTLGPGYDNLEWAFNPHRAVILVVALLLMRAAAAVLTVAGGGAGGLFLPLIGVSAFLGAGYRVPLAAVVFAAEASGRPGFIVPGLIAAMVSQLFMGSASASAYQMAARAGHLERRFPLPLASALRTDAATAAPDLTLDEFFREHAVGLREPATVVVEEGRYLGVIRVEELAETPQERWASTPVSDLMRMDFPTANPRWRLRDALRAMEKADIDLLPVVEGERFVGVVTTAEILKLDDILQMTGDEET